MTCHNDTDSTTGRIRKLSSIEETANKTANGKRQTAATAKEQCGAANGVAVGLYALSCKEQTHLCMKWKLKDTHCR